MKSKTVAILITFFLGTFGIQKFYLGRNAQGIACLFLFWTGVPAFIAIFDFFRILFMSKSSFDKRYN